MATGFPTKANYAAGDILTAANMNDLSGTVNYLQYMPPRNAVLNSNFSVAQRGTSVALAASTSIANSYTLDRWQMPTNANQACTVSQQSTNDTTNLPNIQYCGRFQRNSGQTGTGNLNPSQTLETINSVQFAGKAVTLSFYARAGANYSATSSALGFTMVSGTGTDGNVQVGFTGQASVASGTATLTTTWQRFSYTGTVAATAKQLGFFFTFTPTGTASTNDYFEITGVQLELGSVANTYQPNGATYQAELAACQRYYEKSYEQGTAPATATESNMSLSSQNIGAATTSYIGAWIPFKITKRGAPTMTFYDTSSGASGKCNRFTLGGTDNAAQNITQQDAGVSGFSVYSSGTSSSAGIKFQWTASSEL